MTHLDKPSRCQRWRKWQQASARQKSSDSRTGRGSAGAAADPLPALLASQVKAKHPKKQGNFESTGQLPAPERSWQGTPLPCSPAAHKCPVRPAHPESPLSLPRLRALDAGGPRSSPCRPPASSAWGVTCCGQSPPSSQDPSGLRLQAKRPHLARPCHTTPTSSPQEGPCHTPARGLGVSELKQGWQGVDGVSKSHAGARDPPLQTVLKALPPTPFATGDNVPRWPLRTPSQRWGRWAPHSRLSGPASCLEMLPRPSCLVLPINVENTGRGGRGLCRPLLSGSGDEGCHSGPCHGRHGAQNDSLGRGLGRHGAAPGAARGVVHGDCRPTERVSGNKHFMTFFSYKYALEQLIKQAHKGAGIK